MSFTLDTSGVVSIPHSKDGYGLQHPLWGAYRWTDLDAFTQGYVEALIASVAENDVEPWTWLSSEALATILAECAAMAAMLSVPLEADDGRRIWEHRQEGFPGPCQLDAMLREAFPPLTVSLGDDGRVHLNPAAHSQGDGTGGAPSPRSQTRDEPAKP